MAGKDLGFSSLLLSPLTSLVTSVPRVQLTCPATSNTQLILSNNNFALYLFQILICVLVLHYAHFV